MCFARFDAKDNGSLSPPCAGSSPSSVTASFHCRLLSPLENTQEELLPPSFLHFLSSHLLWIFILLDCRIHTPLALLPRCRYSHALAFQFNIVTSITPYHQYRRFEPLDDVLVIKVEQKLNTRQCPSRWWQDPSLVFSL